MFWRGVRSVALTVVAAIGAATVIGPATAAASPYEQLRFDEQGSQVVKKYCGDQRVRIDFHDQGVIVGRETGPNRLLRYTQSHHGGLTITNLATGLAFTFTWNYLNQDVAVTDNGDGTLTLLSQVPGPESIYGPDGQLLNTSGGTIRYLTVFDTGGTLNDLDDDVVLSETVVSSHGGKPQGEFDYCASFRSLTGG